MVVSRKTIHLDKSIFKSPFKHFYNKITSNSSPGGQGEQFQGLQTLHIRFAFYQSGGSLYTFNHVLQEGLMRGPDLAGMFQEFICTLSFTLVLTQ